MSNQVHPYNASLSRSKADKNEHQHIHNPLEEWDERYHCPAGLEPLNDTTHLFVKRVTHTIDFSHMCVPHFDILSNTGLRIFDAIETTPAKSMQEKPQKLFQISVRNYQGREVMVINGVPGKSYEVGNNGYYWGGVLQPMEDESRKEYPIMAFDDIHATPPEMHEVLLLILKSWTNDIGLCCCHAKVPMDKMTDSVKSVEADILLPNGTTHIGRIGLVWDSSDGINCEPEELGNVIGVKFPRRTDAKLKAILLGALFMMDIHIYFKRTYNVASEHVK